MPPYDLWVTARCARRDLGIEEWPGEDGVFEATAYRAINKFRQQRLEQPEGAERIRSLHEEVCFELHVDRDRGATWYDRENDAVFLLAVGWHEQGSCDDFYEWVARLERSGELYPDEQDYEELGTWREQRDWTRIRRELGPQLFSEAEAEPNAGFSLDLGPCNVGLEALVVDGMLLGYRLAVWPGRDRVDPGLAERIAQAICVGRALTPVFVYSPAWGQYLYDVEPA